MDGATIKRRGGVGGGAAPAPAPDAGHVVPTAPPPGGPGPAARAGLDLHWIPLGAGTPVVRFSGRVFEALSAGVQRRRRCELYHSALVAELDGARWVIEMAPIPGPDGGTARGVVAEGAVGTRWARPLRVFRYEVRRWRDGVIPDLGFAVASPVALTGDPAVVRRALAAVARVPTPVWGRDEWGAGEMWNSNSVVSWVLTAARVAADAGPPPAHGRAPGWDAGCSSPARRQRRRGPGRYAGPGPPRTRRWPCTPRAGRRDPWVRPTAGLRRAR
jgi:hypothetical protein